MNECRKICDSPHNREMPGIPICLGDTKKSSDAVLTNGKLLGIVTLGIVVWTAGWYLVDDIVSIITTNKAMRILLFSVIYLICAIIILLVGWV